MSHENSVRHLHVTNELREFDARPALKKKEKLEEAGQDDVKEGGQ